MWSWKNKIHTGTHTCPQRERKSKKRVCSLFIFFYIKQYRRSIGGDYFNDINYNVCTVTRLSIHNRTHVQRIHISLLLRMCVCFSILLQMRCSWCVHSTHSTYCTQNIYPNHATISNQSSHCCWNVHTIHQIHFKWIKNGMYCYLTQFRYWFLNDSRCFDAFIVIRFSIFQIGVYDKTLHLKLEKTKRN